MLPGGFDSLFTAHGDPDAVETLALRGVEGSARRAVFPDLSAFPRLRELRLWGQRFTALRPSPADGLRRLVLRDNPCLGSLAGIGAWQLAELELGELPALDLDEGLATVGSELPGLARLDLDCTGIARLPSSLAALAIRELRLVDCAAIDFESALAVIAELPGLRVLRLSHTWPSEEDGEDADGDCAAAGPGVQLPDAFARLARVELLSIALPLAEAPRSIFAMPRLRELVLSGTRLTALPPDLAAATGLETLDVSYNARLASLPALGDLRSLRALKLHGTAITALPPGTTELCGLRELEVPRTLGAMPDGFEALRFDQVSVPRAWLPATQLRSPGESRAEHLRLPRGGREHDARSLPDDLGDPRTLYIGMNELRPPALALARVTRLEQLHMITRASFVADALGRLAHLTTLRRVELLLHAPLPAAIGALRSLDTLVVRGVTSIPPELARLAGLRRLELAGTYSEIPDLAGLEQLRELTLHGRCLARLDPSIGRLHALETLELNASVHSLPASLAELANLRRVTLTNAHGLQDASVLARLAGLRELRVRCCQQLAWAPLLRDLAGGSLTRLSADFSGRGVPPALGALDLEQLEITDDSGPPADLSGMRRLGRITLAQPMLDRMHGLLPAGTWLEIDRHEYDEDSGEGYFAPIVTLECEDAAAGT